MSSNKLKIMQLREELDAMLKEYLEHFDTHSDQESKYFVKNINDKQKEIFDLERKKRGNKNGKK